MISEFRLFFLSFLLNACTTDVKISHTVVDNDSDGYTAEVDCDDGRSDVNPTAEERCDGRDNDCDGEVDEDGTDGETSWADADGDGYGDAGATTTACTTPDGYVDNSQDCDDDNGAIYPGAEESDCTDPTDYNCDGSVAWADADGDGWVACEDCDDADGSVNPDAVEVCDEADVDEDCSGGADDADPGVTGQLTWTRDADGDGYGADGGLTTLACEPPTGFVAGEGDCDDLDPGISPDAVEVCDEDDVDEDCSGAADDADPGVDASTWTRFYKDGDRDDYGDPDVSVLLCDAPAGYGAQADDCDDKDGSVNPDASEVCDAIDNDCDALIDEDDPSLDSASLESGYTDADGDGFGDPSAPVAACSLPASAVANDEDCDDGDDAVNPDAVEVCDAADTDEDCSGAADDHDPGATGTSSFLPDADGDGYGDGLAVEACDPPAGTATVDGDCDDTDPDINPDAAEVCDPGDVDEDCDGLSDDDDPSVDGGTRSTWVEDADADGYGADSGKSGLACDPPAGAVTAAGDCDDTDASVNPDASEICDASDVDEDCDGLSDDDDPSTDPATMSTWYPDRDSDGFGDGDAPALACSAPAAHLGDGADCDDGDDAVNPDATERCNGLDDDCDALTDEDDPSLDTSGLESGYTDGDRDGYGDPDSPVSACTLPSGVVDNALDCDDGAADISPSSRELCANGVDEDCDGEDGDCLVAGDYSEPDTFAQIYGTVDYHSIAIDSAGVGDVNGDGHDDVMLVDWVANYTLSSQGAGYLFLGPLSGDYTPADAKAVLLGEDSNDRLQLTDRIGDLDGDGYADLILASDDADPHGYTDEGGAWIFYGPVTGTLSVSAADAEIAGGSSYRTLGVVDGVGDVDGDGLADLTAGSFIKGSSLSNRASLFYGALSGDTTLSAGDVVLQGEDPTDGVGQLDGGEDLDGDGLLDWVLGAAFHEAPYVGQGAVYVILDSLTTGSVGGLYDYKYIGSGANDWLGHTVKLVPDLDGDGYAELLGHAYSLDESYLIYGGSLPASGQMLGVADAVLEALADSPSRAQRSAGDLDADGDDELIVCDYTATLTGNRRGVCGVFDAPLGTVGPADGELRFVGDTDLDYVNKGREIGDLDGDGLPDVMVTASGDDAGAIDAGGVWLFAPR